MIGEAKFLGVFGLGSAGVLLAVSFFVMLAARKEETGLKVFGYVIAVLLWVSAAAILGSGIYKVSTGRYPCMPGKYPMEKGEMHSPMMRR